MEYDKFIEKYLDLNDTSGFNEVLLNRQFKMQSLRERLKKYYLTDAEIDKLFEVIVDAEVKIEKEKQKFPKKYTEEDTEKLYNKVIAIQNQMKIDFDNKLSKLLKEKYEKAKKILEKRQKQK